MRLLLLSIALFILPYEGWGANYAGFWKSNCTDGFGLQIKPAGDQMYSVSFCGPGGCDEPGEWTPNTQIEGDPNYRIISPEKIDIRRIDDKHTYNTYIKCTSDPTWTVKQQPSPPTVETNCSFTSSLKKEDILIAWITDIRVTTQFGYGIKKETTQVEPFRPLAILNGSTIKETLGATIYKGQSFWPILSPKSKPIKLQKVDSFFDNMNDGSCVYFGTLENSDLPRWTLLSNAPLPGVFRTPKQKERDEFYRLNTTCVQQGDYPAGQEPPCVRPLLLAVSDINKNGKPEYWTTEPYMWDTGLTVWENTDGTLLKLLEVCMGCSD